MPIFEYVCRDCKKSFEALVYGAQKTECPHCESRNLEKQLSVFAVSTRSAPVAAGPAASACGSCGDPRGPGACSLDD